MDQLSVRLVTCILAKQHFRITLIRSCQLCRGSLTAEVDHSGMRMQELKAKQFISKDVSKIANAMFA